MVNGYLATFQYCDATSGSVAAPTSPIPPALASGATLCEVTEVVTGLNILFLSICAKLWSEQPKRAQVAKNSLILLIVLSMF
jgi:hypothetical protein